MLKKWGIRTENSRKSDEFVRLFHKNVEKFVDIIVTKW